MGHGHAHSPKPTQNERSQRARKALLGAIIFCLVFMVCEVVFGIEAHSLALITDAMHLLTDVAALSLSLFATVVSQWAGSQRLSFGWHRAEVVGAMGSVFLVWALAGVIIYEACVRIKNIVHCAQSEVGACDNCEAIEGMVMLIVGVCGFFVNVTCAGILMLGGHAHSHGGLPGGSHTCTGHGDHGHSHGPAATPAAATLNAFDGSDHDDNHHGGGSCGGHGHSHDSPPRRAAADVAAAPPPRRAGGDRTPLLKDHQSPTNGSYASHHDSHDDHDDCDGDHGHSHSGGGCGGHAPKRSTSADIIVSSLVVNQSPSASPRATATNGTNGGHSSSEANMNVRGAMIHAIGDCVQSIGVVIAAGIVWGFAGRDGDAHSWYNLADPICSLVFALVTLYTTRYLTVDVFYVLMEATPDSVSLEDLHAEFETIPHVTHVDHLHCWALTPSLKSLSVHLVCPEPQHISSVIKVAKKIARENGIEHSTIQVDTVSHDTSLDAEGSSPLCVSFKRLPPSNGRLGSPLVVSTRSRD